MNIGEKTFNGNGTSLDDKTCHYVIGFKDNLCSSRWNEQHNANYQDSLLWEVEDNIYNAIPSNLKLIFKKWEALSAANPEATAVSTYNRFLASAAEKEITGSQVESLAVEANVLGQLSYYKTSNNRKHSSDWFLRSPAYTKTGRGSGVCRVENTAVVGSDVGTSVRGVSPIGCI